MLLSFLMLLTGCGHLMSVFLKEEPVPLPILMYHSILKDPARAGKYVVSPDVFRADLTYLKEQGYESVTVADLISYTQGGKLPKKPVLITLDDGYYNNLTYVLPILEELDMKAVISVVGVFTEAFSRVRDPNPNYAHLSWADINEITESGHVEIQNHSYNMHRQDVRCGSSRLSGESVAAYKEAFCSDTLKLQTLLEENCGITPLAYTYPYGLIGEGAEGYLKDMGFLCSFTCREKCSFITRDPASLWSLGRFNRPSSLTTAAYMKKLLP